MSTRRDVLREFSGALVATGQTLWQASPSTGVPEESSDPDMERLLEQLRQASTGKKPEALEAVVRELAVRQQAMLLEIEALESEPSCPCLEDDPERPEVEECRQRRGRLSETVQESKEGWSRGILSLPGRTD
jgi:hypothetical protein